MKAKWLGPIALVIVAAAIIAYKHLGADAVSAADKGPQNSATAPSVAAQGATSKTPAVLLVADPAEAESSCGCGEIIRLVRSAASRGVATQELPPNGDRALLSRYKVVVSPTVLVLDPAGATVARFEGEEQETIDALRTHLDKLK